MHSTARSSKHKPLVESSPPPRANNLRTLSPPARLDGIGPAVGPSPHHARSIGRRDRPSSDPTRRPPGWRLRAGMRRNSPVSPSRQAHRPPAHRVAGCPALYALCARPQPRICSGLDLFACLLLLGMVLMSSMAQFA